MRRIKTRILALASAMALSPAAAFASGNTLALYGATFDTTSPPSGSAAALNGGYAISPNGACYSTSEVNGTFNTPTSQMAPRPVLNTAIKGVWLKMPTTLPAAPETIFGDPGLYIAENTSGNIVIGSGAAFATSPSTYNDGSWHYVVAEAQTGVGGWIDGASTPFQVGASTAIDTVSPGGQVESVTGPAWPTFIRAGMPTAAGAATPPFAGEVSEAWCGITSTVSPTTVPTAPLPNNTAGILALWHLASNGTDSATYVPAATTAPTILGQTFSSSTGQNSPPPSVNPTTPAGGFPLQ